jgi:hypothetical protein
VTTQAAAEPSITVRRSGIVPDLVP